ncbi:diguanylate cyclase (GGDEF)-like protein/PAS domain S-box-containing protein [Crossiella equi]|uniref:Diguanylate cyclase (GGDEF)-like protein/PAS domain S-box-containing protein n=1 Tax=Crossiella equi TaxID=130796 RepID=A0ABS5AGM4_9PSEU|nr:EAL domain-containing protein [Crossiella equi]MBP2475736.1 diguanylate cyclase (GGDEF)-like protein/PAS domain S-box-containing protein [Crossiella equi]
MAEASRQVRQPTPRRSGQRKRHTLARKWAYVLAETNYVPLSQAELEAEVGGMLDLLCELVRADPPRNASVKPVAARLVELNSGGEEALTRTMEILGRGLLALPECQPVQDSASRVVATLGALAAAVASATQQATLAQQENLKLSLLKAVRDARWNLRAAETRFEEVATATASGIMITDLTGTLVTVNASVGAILDRSPAELTGHNLFDLMAPGHAPVLREDYTALAEGRLPRVKRSQRLLKRDGDQVMVSLTASLLRGADEVPTHIVTVVEDGTELTLLRNELNRQALHDVSTGLPNGQYFGTQLETLLRRADPKLGVTLLHLELDAFVAVRDGLGDRVAEQLLVAAAQRLRAALTGHKVLLARLTGGEFAVLVEHAAVPDLVSLVRSVREELAEPTYVDGHGTTTAASIGVVHRPPLDTPPSALLLRARQALRRARAGGGGQWELSHPEQDALDRERDVLAATMPGAFENGAIQARYRPLVRLADGVVAGVEVLVCWEHPEAGRLADERCRELAESTGQMVHVGEWLLRTGCGQTGWWRQRLGRELVLAMSLSPQQAADGDLLTRLVAVLAETSFPAGSLLLEVPATALALNHGESHDNLRTLGDLGVHTVLRGFGLGTGALAAATDLSVNSVRLDHRLVGRELVDGSPVTEALRELPTLAHRAGISVIVDGVSTAEQAEFWLAAEADLASGDHFGLPGSPDELAAAFTEPRWRAGTP